MFCRCQAVAAGIFLPGQNSISKCSFPSAGMRIWWPSVVWEQPVCCRNIGFWLLSLRILVFCTGQAVAARIFHAGQHSSRKV